MIIGFAAHVCCLACAIEIDHRSIYLFGHLFDLLRPNQKVRATMNDRAMMCAAMLTLLLERYGASGLLDVHFEHRCTGVDLERRRARFAGSPDFRCHFSGQNGTATGNRSGESKGNGKANGTGVKNQGGQNGTENGDANGLSKGNGRRSGTGDEGRIRNGSRNGKRDQRNLSEPSAGADAIHTAPAGAEPVHIEKE
ncbi:hypothetical protein KFL_002980130 [Klebsormidium nitens]|uniref:Uncharacterized protein n=1 Tax=Klebsormidium nitens TaxID=105231 RepID=A0A1Y1I6L0_KLENI|nr:hypothetical protein KFL_002980130 [Klebsormidium nitens]|eukprot:GAQ86590.1 hypothetical protein KFL_002980130 [Klebsormidium nitens]